MVNPGNRGEWAEIYIFLKLAAEGKLYMADEKMNRHKNAYLQINKLIREEEQGSETEYRINPLENTISIYVNSECVKPDISISAFEEKANDVWKMIEHSKRGNGLFDERIGTFLEGILINKLKSPAQSSSKFFGGTEDITMEVQDYRTGSVLTIGFSCKSKFSTEATLFNASNDNTNFKYKITGNINDSVKDTFNSLYNYVKKKNKETNKYEITEEVAIAERIKYLKSEGCNLEFIEPCSEITRRNLIQSGGKEMPMIVGEMLKYYFFEHNGERDYANISKVLRYLESKDPVNYSFEDLYGIYRFKIGMLLFNMFTGMRMGKVWNGRQRVSGGYICAKKSGEVVAYHADVADEFKDYLINQLSFESSSAQRHNYMEIQKDEEKNEYYLNLNMQVRFSDSEVMKLEKKIDELNKAIRKLDVDLVKKNNTLYKRKNAKKPNSDTISAAQNKVDEIQQKLTNKRNELSMKKKELKNLLSGNGAF